MDYLEKVKDVLDYYGVESGVHSIFGNWVISNDGDIVNVKHMYPIYSYTLVEVDVNFRFNLKSKDWFDFEESTMFEIAYNKAIIIAAMRGTNIPINNIPTIDRLP
jgi:hypothetical protein